MKINVLWIDDEWRKQTAVITDAEQDGIDLKPYESHEEGMFALMADLKGFHAVVLDAKVKKGKDDIVIGLSGLAASRDRLIELNQEGIFLPYFIFTGQPDYMENDVFRDSFGKYYTKGQDNQKLFDDIKKVVLNKDEYIVQRNHHRVFEICDQYFDAETKQILTDILLSIKSPNDLFNDELYFPQIRRILEKLFRQANKFGLLHDKCIVGGKVNLSESNLFLAGKPTKHVNVICSVSHFPGIIADVVRQILSITNAASHTSDTELKNNIDLQAHRSMVKSPYLLYSLTYNLLDVLIWFEEYIKINNDYSFNKGLWKEMQLSPIQSCVLEKDHLGNYHCGEVLISYKEVTEKSYSEGDKINILEIRLNINERTNQYYKNIAFKTQKAEQ